MGFLIVRILILEDSLWADGHNYDSHSGRMMKVRIVIVEGF